jgi:hypothetical protein
MRIGREWASSAAAFAFAALCLLAPNAILLWGAGWRPPVLRTLGVGG